MRFNILDNDSDHWCMQTGPEFIETLRGTALASVTGNEGRFELGLSVDEAGFTRVDYQALDKACACQFDAGGLSITDAKRLVDAHNKLRAAIAEHNAARLMLAEMIRVNPSYNNLVQLD